MHLLMRWTNVQDVLPIENAPILGYLPEFLLEDIAEFYNFLCELCPDIIKNLSVTQVAMFGKFITFCTVSNKVISNPYIRAKLVQSFAYIVMINPGTVT